ncbi:AGE family epimerase/isomerase [Phenylobacterium soli]|uniref:AGE family epimerase/isomerase n=1 Tax=Phenylobacterium soli TaxID=2170551 RepID=A0A328AQQ6_9CAUL|nr:AGE family epimerase/isomerase [Phenylobacterium soli]RAK56076.1 hypothetical protein DJ017_16940 [Phenylobacterium soli]
MSALTFDTLPDAARAYDAWLRDAALPLWARAGVEPGSHAFRDALALSAAPAGAVRRARVQARQVFVYAEAARHGLGPHWLELARSGFEGYRAGFARADGLYSVLADDQGRVQDDTPCLYEQAFTLLAMAALTRAGGADLRPDAERLLGALQARRLPAGGFVELTDQPFQSNAHMHLLEAVMAWEAVGGEPLWRGLTDEIVALCLAHFIDPDGGFLREFFDGQWRPAAGDDGRYVEPGHQFEWAWLLTRWARARGEPEVEAAARRLLSCGLRGIDRERGVAVNGLWDDLTLRDASTRLWPQTEWLKAALILGREDEALAAANGLAKYLDVPVRGLWRDKLKPDGTWVEEPAPASSFYHITLAVLELRDWAAAHGVA